MADEKAVVKKPRFENPLTKKEQILIVILGLALGGVYYGGEQGVVGLKKSLEDYKAQASGRMKAEEAAKIDSEIEQADAFKEQNAKWETLLPKLEKFFPSDPRKALTYIDLLAAISRVAGTELLTSSEEKTPIDFQFTAEKKAEVESDPVLEGDAPVAAAPEVPVEDRIPADLLVKYRERDFKFRLRTTYAGWLKILENLEKTGKFYRFKKVLFRDRTTVDPINAVPGSQEKYPFSIEVEGVVASYHVVEFGKQATEEVL